MTKFESNQKIKTMNIEKIKNIVIPILQKYKISKAGLFGSFVKNSMHPESDVDLLVELTPDFSLLDFVRVKLELEEALNTKVDLVEYKAIKPRLKNRILAEEMRIYG